LKKIPAEYSSDSEPDSEIISQKLDHINQKLDQISWKLDQISQNRQEIR
jgi:hypothetical protein